MCITFGTNFRFIPTVIHRPADVRALVGCADLGFLGYMKTVARSHILSEAVMDSKTAVAVGLLGRIKQDRDRVENSERALIPAAFQAGLTAARIAELTGATVEHVEEVGKEGAGGWPGSR